MDFFNDLGKRLNEAAKNIAGWGRDENALSDRLADELKRAEAALNERYAALGRECYEKLTGLRDSIPEESVAQVRAARERVEALNEQHRRETSRRRCPNRGSIQEGDARFCSACGKPMVIDAEKARREAEETIEYCPECGAAREGEENRCSICGASFAAVVSEEEDRSAPIADALARADAPEEPDDEERYEE